jgi:hypothetical protein
MQLRYCIIKEDVEMEMHDWKDDWRIPDIGKEVPTGTEVKAEGTKEVVQEGQDTKQLPKYMITRDDVDLVA